MPRCEPPRKWMRLTASMVSGIDVLGVALHEPLEPVADADDVEPVEAGADGGGADDAVDAGGGAAADEDGELVHCREFEGSGLGFRSGFSRFAVRGFRGFRGSRFRDSGSEPRTLRTPEPLNP